MKAGWLAALLGSIVQPAQAGHPSDLYIVTVYVSDNGPSVRYELLEVQPDGSGSLVRFTGIRLVENRLVVNTETRHTASTVAEATANSNPCAVTPQALAAAVKRFPRDGPKLWSITRGIVARCGPASVTLAVPRVEDVDIAALGRAHPEISALWALDRELKEAAFRQNADLPYHPESSGLDSQKAGAAMVPQLRSGHYDDGLAAACRGSLMRADGLTFKELLQDYQPPPGTHD